MIEHSHNRKFVVPTELVLGGPGLETITTENYTLLIEDLGRMGIYPMRAPEIADDFPICKEDLINRGEEIGYARNMAARTWNALTGYGRYPVVFTKLGQLSASSAGNGIDLDKIPDWMRGLYLTPDSLSYRGLSRALTEDRIRSLRNISDAGHDIVKATVTWAESKING